jgi:hypothetical protein
MRLKNEYNHMVRKESSKDSDAYGKAKSPDRSLNNSVASNLQYHSNQNSFVTKASNPYTVTDANRSQSSKRNVEK